MNDTLSKKIKIGYGAGSFLEAGLYNFATSYLMLYLTSVARLSPDLAGFICSGAILMEAVGGMVAGRVSDQFYSRYGRRRPFMIVSAVGAFFILNGIFINFQGGELLRSVFYFLMIAAFWSFYAAFYVTYIALGGELTCNYDERTSLRSYARFFAIMGNLVCTAAPLVVVERLGRLGFSQEASWFLCVLFIAAFGLFSGVISWNATRGTETVYEGGKGAGPREPFWEGLRDYAGILRLKIYLIVLGGRSCFLLAYTLYTATMIYYMKYMLGLSNAGTSTIFLAGIITSLIYMPVIARLAVVFGKQQQISAALLVSGIGGVALYAMGIDSYAKVLVYVAFFSFAHSTCWQLFNSIFYDITEVDEFVCGRRREGSITSLTSVLGTLVISAGLWIVGVFLDFSGYDPHLAAQAGRTLAMIENLFVLFPSVLLFFAAIFLKFYPMSRERFYVLKEGIERKKSGDDYGELLPQIKKLL